MTPTLALCLGISAALFSIGLMAALSRNHAVFILIGIEIMLAAANINFVAFWRFSPRPETQSLDGVMIAIFVIAIAAAEAAVGLALVIEVYRHYRTTHVDKLDSLKG